MNNISGTICGTNRVFTDSKNFDFTILLKQFWSGRRGSNPQHPAWEFYSSPLYLHNLQNDSENTHVHALHTAHALPDLRIAAGRLRDDVSIRESRR